MDDVLSGERVVGKLERQCVDRHLRDLARVEAGEAPHLRFNEKAGIHVLLFFTHHVRHTKGRRFKGKLFRFCRQSAWQAFILCVLFGWQRYDEEDGEWYRRFTSAYISVARKNGKTMLAAAIALYLLAFDGEAAPEIYFAATTRDQARRGFDQAKEIIRASPNKRFRDVFRIIDSTSRILVPRDDGVCRALGRNKDSHDGLNPSGNLVDELHAHKDREQWDVLESGTDARSEPITIGITTAGGKRNGLCWDLDRDAERVLEGVTDDDSYFAYVARPDEGDHWSDPVAWKKASPNLGVSVRLQSIKDALKKAQNNASAIGEFRRKRCNSWTDARTAWLEQSIWDACNAPVDAEALRGERCYTGVDLANVSDVTAAVSVFPRPEGYFDVVPRFWLPGDLLGERVKSDRVPYDAWRDAGFVDTTDGDVTDQDAVKMHLLNFHERYDQVEIPIDPKEAWKLTNELDQLGLNPVHMNQGFWLSSGVKELERLLREGKIRHGGNPVLRWMFANVEAQTNPQGRVKFVKGGQPRERIDGMVALVMAIQRAVEVTESDVGVYALDDDEEATA